jgi:predicted PhzF superfamily epimerase YddE/YHI9
MPFDGGAVASGWLIQERQGVEISRRSDLYLSARIESARVREVRVAGSTVLVAKRRLFLS